LSDTIPEQIKQTTYIKAPPEKVYDTITSGEGWNAFFTKHTTVEPHPGGSIMFRWENWGPDRYTCEAGGPVLEAERPTRFVFQWGTKFTTTITFELTAEHGGTTVRLTETGSPNTPEGRANMLECASGWGEALTLLKFYLEFGVVYTPPES
jgi:uncharacterized protein YndB with AHSA1/START domain